MTDPILLLGGHGSTAAARAAVEGALRKALGPAVVLHSIGGPVDVLGGLAWWDGELSESDWPALVALLDGTATALGLGDTAIVVAGFSQGGAAALAWAAASARAQPLAGVVCVAGFLPACVAAALAAGAALLPPALVVITEDDEVVDPFLGGIAARTLRRAGAVVADVAVGAGHEWTAAATSAVVDWLATVGHRGRSKPGGFGTGGADDCPIGRS